MGWVRGTIVYWVHDSPPATTAGPAGKLRAASPMATVQLLVSDPPKLYTLKAMFEAEGWRAGGEDSDVAIADSVQGAVAAAKRCPALVLIPVAEVTLAVQAMKEGVFGYVLVPFLPGEAVLMVKRALDFARVRNAAQGDVFELATLEEVERRHINNVLRLSKHNQAKAARALGIGRNTLWRKLKHYEELDKRRENPTT